MRNPTKILARSILAAAVAVFVGCNSVVDDPDVNVILEVATLAIPSVTAALDSVAGTCVFTITNASATFNNKPKNHFAIESPFNDIRLLDVTVNYVWDDGIGVTGPVTFDIAGTIPANGTQTSTFSVINGFDVVTPSREGRTASLSMLFRGMTISGELVTQGSGGTLTVNTCQ